MKTRKLVSVLLVSILSLTMLPAVANGSARYAMGKDGYSSRFSLGAFHSAVIGADGALYIVGYNYSGQLGLNNTVNTKVPSAVPGLTNVCSVSLGENHSAVITTDGSLYTWGANSSGQLGLGDNISMKIPIKVAGIKNVTTICLGGSHSAAITSDGSLYTWGNGHSGRLGLGNSVDANTPKKVSIPNNTIAVSLGSSHSAAITADRSLYTWGTNNNGELGHGDNVSVNVPKKVNSLSNVVAVSLGVNYSAAITADGSLYTWGRNNYGQLGYGNTVSIDVPKKVNALSKVIAVSLGFYHSAAITADGSLYTWGRNNYGQLGLGDTIDRNAPEKVGLSNVAAISLGGYHSSAVLSDGRIFCWGYNSSGQLGLGHTTDKSSPQFMTNGVVPFTEVSVAVQTGDASDIKATSAVITGNSYVAKGATVTGAGIMWLKSGDMSNGIVAAAGITSPFNVELKNLSPGTKYFYQAYVNTTVGGNKQYLGEIKSFTTINAPAEIKVNSVKTMSAVYVVKGNTVTLPYGVLPYNAANKGVKWYSSDTSIATVDAGGNVKGVKAGSTVITVTTADGGKTASCIVNVVAKAVALKTLKISPSSSMTLNVGSVLQVKPTLNPKNATGIVPEYKSSTTAVAFINKAGVITTLSPGKTTITVTAGTQVKKFTLTVEAP